MCMYLSMSIYTPTYLAHLYASGVAGTSVRKHAASLYACMHSCMHARTYARTHVHTKTMSTYIHVSLLVFAQGYRRLKRMLPKSKLPDGGNISSHRKPSQAADTEPEMAVAGTSQMARVLGARPEICQQPALSMRYHFSMSMLQTWLPVEGFEGFQRTLNGSSKRPSART